MNRAQLKHSIALQAERKHWVNDYSNVLTLEEMVLGSSVGKDYWTETQTESFMDRTCMSSHANHIPHNGLVHTLCTDSGTESHCWFKPQQPYTQRWDALPILL